MKVEQMMTRDVKTVAEHEPLMRAAKLMWEHDIGSVPVVDQAGTVIGMITDRDLCMAAYTQGRRLDEITVKSAMSGKLVACAPADTLESATTLMKRAQVRRLPVIDKKAKLVGILSLGDLSRAAENEPNQRVREQYMHQVELTLAAVARPRSMMQA